MQLELVHDRLDHDVFVLQHRSLRFTVARSFVLDNVEFGKATKILADRAFIAVELAREVANRFDAFAVLIEVLDEGKTALGEDITSILSTQDEDVRVSPGIEVGGERILLEYSFSDAVIRWRISTEIRSRHGVAYDINGYSAVDRLAWSIDGRFSSAWARCGNSSRTTTRKIVTDNVV